jgi:uncharacterized LabA/DUF88 family protein
MSCQVAKAAQVSCALRPNKALGFGISGNCRFRRLVEAVQRRGVRVTVATISTNPSIIADELRRQPDAFVDLNGLRPQISRQANTKPWVVP